MNWIFSYIHFKLICLISMFILSVVILNNFFYFFVIELKKVFKFKCDSYYEILKAILLSFIVIFSLPFLIVVVVYSLCMFFFFFCYYFFFFMFYTKKEKLKNREYLNKVCITPGSFLLIYNLPPYYGLYGLHGVCREWLEFYFFCFPKVAIFHFFTCVLYRRLYNSKIFFLFYILCDTIEWFCKYFILKFVVISINCIHKGSYMSEFWINSREISYYCWLRHPWLLQSSFMHNWRETFSLNVFKRWALIYTAGLKIQYWDTNNYDYFVNDDP